MSLDVIVAKESLKKIGKNQIPNFISHPVRQITVEAKIPWALAESHSDHRAGWELRFVPRGAASPDLILSRFRDSVARFHGLCGTKQAFSQPFWHFLGGESQDSMLLGGRVLPMRHGR